jgi:two-component system response regulator MprA
MLSARDAVADRITGLEAGADDYLAKPFDLDELVARLLALHRRNRHAHDTSSDRYMRYADLEVDRKSWVARRAGEPIPLTLTEFRILDLLMQTPEAVWRRERLMSEIWGDNSMELASNSLEAHIANLRRKLERDATSRLVHTVRGVGYVLRLEL